MLSSIFVVVRHRTSRIVSGSDLNVSLAPILEGLTGSRIHSNLISAFLSHIWNGIMMLVGRIRTPTKDASFTWITCLSLSMCMVRLVWCGKAIV